MHSFNYYAGDAVVCHDALQINGRLLGPIRYAAKVVWFDFNTLCATARSSSDYLQVVARFSVVMLSDVPVIAANSNDIIVRFINLIDVLYGQQVRFIMSAAAPIEQLYTGVKSAFAFKRTCSRLQEMQGERYIVMPAHGEENSGRQAKNTLPMYIGRVSYPRYFFNSFVMSGVPGYRILGLG